MKINGFQLPRQLCRLINTGRWSAPMHGDALGRMAGVDDDQLFDFLLLPGDMAAETLAMARMAVDDDHAALFSLRSSRRDARPVVDRSVLDVDKLVMIAMNRDDQAIFLDYRSDEDEPSVVLANWADSGGDATHRRIASTFGDFADAIGLKAA